MGIQRRVRPFPAGGSGASKVRRTGTPSPAPAVAPAVLPAPVAGARCGAQRRNDRPRRGRPDILQRRLVERSEADREGVARVDAPFPVEVGQRRPAGSRELHPVSCCAGNASERFSRGRSRGRRSASLEGTFIEAMASAPARSRPISGTGTCPGREGPDGVDVGRCRRKARCRRTRPARRAVRPGCPRRGRRRPRAPPAASAGSRRTGPRPDELHRVPVPEHLRRAGRARCGPRPAAGAFWSSARIPDSSDSPGHPRGGVPRIAGRLRDLPGDPLHPAGPLPEIDVHRTRMGSENSSSSPKTRYPYCTR